MGFYQPAQIVSDAQKHGVTIQSVDINYSEWDNTLGKKENNFYTLRLGFRQVKGLQQEEVKKLMLARKTPFTQLHELYSAGVHDATLETLADADAFRSIGLDRRQALWELTRKDKPIALFANHNQENAAEKVHLPAMNLSEHVVQDYAATSLSIKAHPLSFIREKLIQLHCTAANQLPLAKNGDVVKVAGLVLVKQRPGTAKGVCFMTIEDETGCANVVFFQNMFEKFRKEILQSRLILVEGKLQIEGEVIHVIAENCFNISKLLRQLTATEQENHNETLFPQGRNFK